MVRSRAAVLAVAAAALLGATVSAAGNATTISFGELLGSPCSVDADCGYVPSLACVNGRCDYCRLGASDCGDYQGDTSKRCQAMTTPDGAPVYGWNARDEVVEVGYCIEKDLFGPFGWNDVVGTLIAFVSTALGSGCGIGGGGLLVPLFIFVMGLSPKHAIPLSKATIFGNAVAIFLFNFNRKHPANKNVPIINYAVAAVMEPMTLVGTVMGVMLNKTLPNWLILVLLILLLATITYKTVLKGISIRDRESRQQASKVKAILTGPQLGSNAGRWSVFPRLDVATAARRWLSVTRRNKKLRQTKEKDLADFESLPPLGSLAADPEKQSLLSLQDDEQHQTFGTFDQGSLVEDDVWAKFSTRQSIEQHEAKRFPLRYIWPLAVSWAIVLVQSMLRGGHGAPSIVGVPCGSDTYWLITLLPLAILIAITAYIGHGLRLLNRLKVLSEYPFAEGDIHWIRHHVVVLPAMCIMAGIAAGLLGVGGGLVKGPILLEMDILPAVQSATTSFMILFTSSSTTLQFAINGQFPGEKQFDYAIWFIFIGFLGGLTGQKVVAMLVKKFKRESIIVFLLAATIGLSCVMMSLVSFESTLRDIERGTNLGMHSLCGDGA